MHIDPHDYEWLDSWLDANVEALYREQPLAQDWARIAKIGEECGEAIQAFIGSTGQNPRKGYTHGQREVVNEIADVLFTALLAIQHFTKNKDITAEIIHQRWVYRMANAHTHE